MTLDTIRKKIDSSYKDDFLNSLPVYFPVKSDGPY